MLIGKIELTDNRVRLVDIDGSTVDIFPDEALALADWIDKHREQIRELIQQDGQPIVDERNVII